MSNLDIKELLLKLNCVQVRFDPPFTYASGLKGPFYCDNRKLLASHEARSFVADSFVKMIQESYSEVEVVLGLATGGIPLGMLVADKLQKPFGYVRSKAKDHGATRVIEGGDYSGKKAILIEDLVNQGASLEKALVNIEEEEIQVMACLCVISYESKQANQISSQHETPIHYLASAKNIADYAYGHNKISSAQKESFDSWLHDAQSWSKNYC